jgi:hypothetical protein
LQLNSVLKAVASALELVLTALLSVPVLGNNINKKYNKLHQYQKFITNARIRIVGIPLTWETMFAILIISLAVLIYAKHPVKNEPVKDLQQEKA